MFGKLRTGHLLAILAGLSLLWWLSGRWSSKAQDRTFREVLMRVDTGAVTSFTLVPAPMKGFPDIRFTRVGNGWRVAMGRDSAEADPAPINEVLAALSDVRPVQLIGGLLDVQRIHDLEPMSMERLLLTVRGRPYELRVGRCTLGDDPVTIVSPVDDTLTYAVKGLLGMYTDMPYSGWLPKYLVRGDPQNWSRLTFQFPDGTGYAMERREERWFIGDVELDQERTLSYLRGLSGARGNELVDPRDTLTARPAFRLMVEDSTRAQPIVVLVSALSPDRFIVRSSLNPANVMPFDPQKQIVRMFRPPYAFFPKAEGGS